MVLSFSLSGLVYCLHPLAMVSDSHEKADVRTSASEVFDVSLKYHSLCRAYCTDRQSRRKPQ